MENNNYRITGYNKEDDYSFILDSNGKFEKLWQFSSYLVCKGIDIIAVSKAENIIDVNITPAERDSENLILRATADGKPQYINQVVNGITYKAIKVANKIYIPNKENTNE